MAAITGTDSSSTSLPDSTPAPIPFGLAVAAREPIPFEDVNVAALIYDPEQQITLVRDGQSSTLSPWCKHSTGKTNTNSNTDGHGKTESDTDQTED